MTPLQILLFVIVLIVTVVGGYILCPPGEREQ